MAEKGYPFLLRLLGKEKKVPVAFAFHYEIMSPSLKSVLKHGIAPTWKNLELMPPQDIWTETAPEVEPSPRSISFDAIATEAIPFPSTLGDGVESWRNLQGQSYSSQGQGSLFSVAPSPEWVPSPPGLTREEHVLWAWNQHEAIRRQQDVTEAVPNSFFFSEEEEDIEEDD